MAGALNLNARHTSEQFCQPRTNWLSSQSKEIEKTVRLRFFKKTEKKVD